jgi:subfamily B ATP-binding cassette protein MsbA
MSAIPEELSTAARVLRLARGRRSAVWLAMCLGLMAAILEGAALSFVIPLSSLATGGTLDTSIPIIGPVLGFIQSRFDLGGIELVAIVALLFVASIGVGVINLLVSTRLAMRFAHDLRVRVFDGALTRPIAQIEGLPSGKFVNDLASNTWSVCDALFVIIGVMIEAVAFTVFLVFLLLLSPFYTAILIAMTVVMALVVIRTTAAVRSIGGEAVRANEGLMAYIWDALGGLRVIRGFGREAHERDRFAVASGTVRDVFVRMRVLGGIVAPITMAMTLGMVAIILSVAILRGDTLSTIAGFLAIAYRMQPRMSAILEARTRLRSLATPVIEIEEAIGLAEDERARHPSQGFDRLAKGVTVEGVWARYPNSERPALSDVTCAFPFGQVTAVAGYSGAGKSTLVALLLRFIRPERGRILIDGTDLDAIRPEDWHKRIAFVEQNAFLFNASIRENIGYGDLAAGAEEIEAAARVAQAEDFIRALPNGFDTMIGDNGVRLSQGQRQRIALARSLLRRPDVLILDEATNALDRPTERALRDALQAERGARAVIVIAHRRETIENADHVIVIEQGRIVQEGSPAALAKRPGVFQRLYVDGGDA